MQKADPAKVALEYAPAAPSRRRRRIRRLALLLLLLCIGLAGWRWGPAVKQHAELLYWQRKCLNFQIPPDTLLYERDLVKAAQRLKQNADYVPAGERGGAAMYYPQCLRELDARAPTGLLYDDFAITFLHERCTPSGKRRLVVMYSWPWYDFGVWNWRLYNPGGVSKPTLLNKGETSFRERRVRGSGIPAYLGPCQADPTDATHFILPVLANGKQVAIYDARLTDQDTIEITLRPTP